jgi:hypothetical protein
LETCANIRLPRFVSLTIWATKCSTNFAWMPLNLVHSTSVTDFVPMKEAVIPEINESKSNYFLLRSEYPINNFSPQLTFTIPVWRSVLQLLLLQREWKVPMRLSYWLWWCSLRNCGYASTQWGTNCWVSTDQSRAQSVSTFVCCTSSPKVAYFGSLRSPRNCWLRSPSNPLLLLWEPFLTKSKMTSTGIVISCLITQDTKTEVA